MTTKKAVLSARALLGATTVACALFAGSVAAKDYTVTIAVHVSARGLDLNQPTDARTLYTRLENAAWVVCTRGTQVNLTPVDDLKGCLEKALGDAIRSVKAPLLTQIYLENHTLRDAAAQGIDVPAQVAAK